MPCYHPLRGWRSRQVNSSGKRPIVFKINQGYEDQEVVIPCGRCIGCRLERSRQWAIRCMHEASLHDENCFITLTYDNEHLPYGGTLVKADYQKFMKRLRKRFEPREIRFFHCGEYGENTFRPHYHACLFNFDFNDKVLFKKTRDHRLFTSPTLSELWPFGLHTIGAVSFDSAAYVARYILKKVNGKDLEKTDENGLTHYERLMPNGELIQLEPEYTTMSRRPGIAKPFFDKYFDDIYPSDNVIVNGKPMNPPKFYDGLLEKENPNLLLQMKGARKKGLAQNPDDRTLRRLRDRETCKLQKINLLPRRIETDD